MFNCTVDQYGRHSSESSWRSSPVILVIALVGWWISMGNA